METLKIENSEIVHRTFEIGDDAEIAHSDGIDRVKIMWMYKSKMWVDNLTQSIKNQEVPLMSLRPLPPDDGDCRLALGAQVDVDDGHGWFGGVITGVLENNHYLVCLNSGEQPCRLPRSEIRLHRDWIDGKWVLPPQNKVTSKGMVNFTKGMPIEVGIDESGFEGSWYSATILKAVGDRKFLAKYKTLRNDDNTDYLIEEFDLRQIRPVPPEVVLVDSYSPCEVVDAYVNEGWWKGKVLKALSDSRYKVSFFSGEVLVILHSDLRPHQDWIDGKWVMAPSLNDGYTCKKKSKRKRSTVLPFVNERSEEIHHTKCTRQNS